MLVCQGFDSLQDSADVDLKASFVSELERARDRAKGIGERSVCVAPVQVGDETMYVRPNAPQGHNWILANDDLMFLIRRPDMPSPISTRYSAAGLWEHGHVELYNRAQQALRAVGLMRRADYHRITRVDYAFDFYSPKMTADMHPALAGAVVAPSGAKWNAWGEETRMQTLTIGSKSGIQLQLYDKFEETKTRPEKSWMRDLWRAHGHDPVDGHMWRLECRFGAEYLRNRNLRMFGDMLHELEPMLAEALTCRRLTVPSATDSNRRRWPVHQLWWLAFASFDANHMPPIGRKVTGKRHELVVMLQKQIMGLSRSVSVLETGRWDDHSMRLFMGSTVEDVHKQPAHRAKVEALIDRYELVDEAW